MRDILEALKAQIEWDSVSRSVKATQGSTIIVLTIGSPTAYVDGRAVHLSAPAQIINGSTYVPLRFVAESTGAQVQWSALTRTVSVTTGAGEGIPVLGEHSGEVPAPRITSPTPNETVGPAVDVVGSTVPGSAIRIVTYVYQRADGALVTEVPGILRNVPANGEFTHTIALPTNKDKPAESLHYDIHCWTVMGGTQSKPIVIRVYRK